MGNLTGVAGGGSLPEQIQFAGASTVAGTKPTYATAPLLSPASQTATFNTGGVQRKGSNVAMLRIMVGAIVASGLFSVKVQHSNDDGVADAYADLAAGSQGVIPGAAVTTGSTIGGANSLTDTNLVTDLRQAKLWIRYTFTLISGTSAVLAAALLLGAYDVLPPTDN